MRILSFLSVSLCFLSYVTAQAVDDAQVKKEKHNYQSDVARLRKIVINSLYSHRDVFLRELISNSNDALEKLRLTGLTDKSIWDGSESLNVSIKTVKNEDGPGGRIIITDTGIGMTPEELTANLGTLAKSGTTEFLQRAETTTDATGTGNLIGAFGLGFYSSFLVADHVYVASVSPKSAKDSSPQQYVFSSVAEDSSFEVYPDPRGNTLGSHGTEITLLLKEDAYEYLDTHRLQELVNKHSVFSSNFPIYLFTQRTEQVPDEEAVTGETAEPSTDEEPEKVVDPDSEEEDEAIVEEVGEESETAEEKPVKMKDVVVDEWVHLNPMAPIWARDPKNVTDEEYELFYQATFRDFVKPSAWHHFSGDSGSGVSFKAILYIPGHLDNSFWQQPSITSKDVRLMVKRVFITSDLGEDPLPKWASFVKVVIDADDLPLNVSRETLQSSKFLKQVKQIIMRRLIQLLQRLAKDDEEKFLDIQKTYGSVLKLGAVESQEFREKLSGLARFPTNQRNNTSLDQYLETRKKGQKQIFYLADLAKSPEVLKKSVFVEKLDARGYEVLLLNDPLDEILLTNLKRWQKLPFQDVAKAGLKFGDEDEDDEDKESAEELAERYKPLLEWLKERSSHVVRDVIISNRLVTSPCAIVADEWGYTANVEKLMSASNRNKVIENNFMHELAKKQKLLEINTRSPLIQGLLRRVERLPAEGEDKDVDAENELQEVASILIDGALVRSGFEVPDSNEFFARVDRVLRRSLGVSETAPTDSTVKPAPPVDPSPFVEEDSKPGVIDVTPEGMEEHVRIEMEEIPEDEYIHDEL